MFYTYRQNNSHGRWNGPKFVAVEADSLQEADQRAEESGYIYFDGVTKGKDCDCCGNRWSRAYDSDLLTETPQTYGGYPLEKDVRVVIIYRNKETFQG